MDKLVYYNFIAAKARGESQFSNIDFRMQSIIMTLEGGGVTNYV